jgi:general nucleoside transport system permease protein
MNNSKTKTKNQDNFFKRTIKKDGVQSIIASLICVIIGLFIGYIVLLCINPAGAWDGITTIIKNFFTFNKESLRLKYFGQTLANTAPLIRTGLAILFAYKAGLFNIGAAGQYTMGACACIYAGIVWQLPWYVCMLFAILAGGIWGAIVGVLKAYLNVNEVISAIMLNWIGLYLTNIIITGSSAWDTTKHETYTMLNYKNALIPNLGLDSVFGGCKYITLAVFIAIFMAILVLVVLNFTTFGYELKGTGFNKNAAKYCGMKEKRNIIVTMFISGGLAGLGASLYYQTGIEPWYANSSVPGMGFTGISAAFLGGLNPIGTIFSSYVITHINSAGARLDTAYYSAEISDLISAIIIYLCAFVGFFKMYITKVLNKRNKIVDQRFDTPKDIPTNESAKGEK